MECISPNNPVLINSHTDEVEVLSRQHQWRLLDEYAAGVQAAAILAASSLSIEQRRALKAQVRIGDRARQRLIASNMRLVATIARRFVRRSPWLTFEDLVQEGATGLNRAIEKFDRSVGTTFSTYATWWIRQSITRAIGNSGLIRVPIHVQDNATLRNSPRLSRLRRFESVERLREREVRSEPADPDDWRAERPPLPDSMLCHDEGFDRIEMQAVLSQIMPDLSVREADIIRRRFGFGCDPQTLEEIGHSYGITRERIRQIEEKTLERLRRLMGVCLNREDPGEIVAATSPTGIAA